MNERDLWWKVVGIGVLVALAVAAVYPMSEKIKYGIDLYGGYSLTYEIDDSGLSPGEKTGLSEKVIRVLKERIDPKGVFNLVWRPIGNTRLEIQMPRPSDEVRKSREAYEAEQAAIAASHVRRSEILRALSRTGADRDAAINALVRNIEARRALLQTAATAYDAQRTAQAEYDARVAKIKADNLSAADIHAALTKPGAERPAALAALVRSIPARQALLDDAAKTWDALEAARPSTQPAADGAAATKENLDAFAAKQRAHDDAVAKVLAANVDPNNLKEGVTINQVVELEEKSDKAIADVLATNIEIGTLQGVLELAATNKSRKDEIKKLTDRFPGLAKNIEAMVAANDALKTRRRGEGRLEDPADLQRLLKGTGVLEFRILAERTADNPGQFDSYLTYLKERGPRPKPGEENFQWFEIEDPKDFLKTNDPQRNFESIKMNLPGRIVVERHGDKFYVLAHIAQGYTLVHKAGVQEWTLKGARPDQDENGRPCMAFTLDERGGSMFYQLTSSSIQRQLSIFLDDQCVSHATIQSAIRTSGRITGSFTRPEVDEMCRKLNAGSLPKKLKDPPISVRSIGPSLGESNRTAGLTAAAIGSIVVVAIMLLYYYYAGLVAVIAVTMNTLLVLSSMAIMGATLTLPGIAGLVLSVGMAVDANVLINERMREELGKGAIVRMAIKLGYERAASAIIDSNLTTIITCIILYFLGSEDVKGFGLTLGIGVVCNLFTAYLVTRVYFEFMSLAKLPADLNRRAVSAGVVVTLIGAAFYGLGMALAAPEARDTSSLIGMGRALAICGPVMLLTTATFWLCRALHQGAQKDGKQRIPMRSLIGIPNIDWCGMRNMFYGISITAVVLGAILIFTKPKDKLYDIEFLGGTQAQIDLKTPGSISRDQVEERLKTAATTLTGYAKALDNATVKGSGDSWTINTPGVPAARLEPVIKLVMDGELSEVSPVTYADPAAETVNLRTRVEAKLDQGAIQNRVKAAAVRLTTAAESIGDAGVQTIGDDKKSFEIVSRETSKELVVSAIMEQLRDSLDIQPSLTFKMLRSPNGPYFPIRSEKASENGLPIPPAELAALDLQGWRGGVAIVLDELNPPQSLDVIKKRLRGMRFQPGFEQTGWRESECIGLTTANAAAGTYSRVMVVVSDEAYPLEQGSEPSGAWIGEFAEKEVALAQAALERQTSLSQITQFDKQVSGEATLDAQIALVLSWLAIIIFLWFRFGDARWGLAAVVALIHDIFIVLLCIGLAHIVAGSPLGNLLKLEAFRIDLTMVAALLTIVGYSVNDTIVVYDRIRENRGRSREVTTKIVNDAISQTLSRTIMTGMTTLAVSLVMYWVGGKGIHGFNFAMFIGILTGTYSSFAVAGQLLLSRRARAATAAAAAH